MWYYFINYSDNYHYPVLVWCLYTVQSISLTALTLCPNCLNYGKENQQCSLENFIGRYNKIKCKNDRVGLVRGVCNHLSIDSKHIYRVWFSVFSQKYFVIKCIFFAGQTAWEWNQPKLQQKNHRGSVSRAPSLPHWSQASIFFCTAHW